MGIQSSEIISDSGGFLADGPQSWYALRVNSNCERRITATLGGMGYESFFPTRWQLRYWGKRSRRVVRALIPGYVFARFNSEKRFPVLTISGVAYIVGTRSGPVAVDLEELAAVRRIAESGSEAEPWPYLAVGQNVELQEGPLRGLRGKLISVSNQLKVIVSVGLLQRSVAVHVERQCVRQYDERDLAVFSGAAY